MPFLMNRLLALSISIDLLVVDDNSPDGTGSIVDAFRARREEVHLLHRRRREGLGRALSAGFQWALEHGYRWIINMDGDLSHQPEDIPALLRACAGPRLTCRAPEFEQADLALGSRYCEGTRVHGWPRHRLILSRSAARYVKAITGMPFYDPKSGFRCFSRGAIEAIGLSTVRARGYFFHIETLHRIWRKGLRITEVPIAFINRTNGKSKMSFRVIGESVWRTWQMLARERLSTLRNFTSNRNSQRW